MFEQIANLIEQQGDALASEWLADLERRGNVLVAGENRGPLWRDALRWITLLMRALRTGDVGPLRRASLRTAQRLALAGLPLAGAVDAVLAFKHALWRALDGLPDLDSEVAHATTRVIGEWFDSIVLSMAASYEPRPDGAESRSLTVERALSLSRRAEDQSAISDLAQEMVSERDPRRLLNLIARSAAHLAGAQRAAVVVSDDGAPRYRGAYRLPLSDLNDYARRGGKPLSGALEPAETRILGDLTQGADPAGAARARIAAKLQVRSLLAVPMQAGDHTLGLLELFDPLAEQGWTNRDVALVRDVAAQAALAMENTRLLTEAEERARRLAALNEIGRALASQINSPHLLDSAAAGVSELLQASSALVWLRVPRTRTFTLRAAHGWEAGGCDFELGEGVLGQAAAGDAIIITPEAGCGMPWGRGWAVVAPLRIGHRVLGLLAAQRKQGAFHDDDVAMLEALAGQVVVAVQNAQLYDESERLARQLNASIVALGDALAAALDMPELLQVIADRGAEMADAAAAIVFMENNGAGMAARAVAARGEAASAAADPQAYEPIAALAGQRGQPVSASAGAKGVDQRMRRVMLDEHVRAVHAFPLTVRGRVAGALCILTCRRALGRDERSLLASFSRQAAVGVENVMLFNETRQRLNELADLSRASAGVTSTLDQSSIVAIIVDSVTRSLQVPVAATVLLDESGEFYLPQGGHHGLPPSFVGRFAVGADSIARAVVADQRIKVIADIAKEGRCDDSLVAGLDLGSLICAPIRSGDNILGILLAADRLPRTFRQHEESLLSAYANEAALALQNAYHYQAVSGHARELEGILDATKTVSSTLELQPVLDHVARAAASLLVAPVTSIMLLDPSGARLTTVATCGLAVGHELHADLRAGESLPGIAVRELAAMTSTDLPRDGRFKHRAAAREEGLLSALSVPLSVKGKALGVLTAYSRSARSFTDSQERLLTTLAAQASVAIENARLYAEAREQTRLMRLLMEEVNHRIKNNLQSIIGIVQLHMAQVDDSRIQDALRQIIGRVQAIAVVHELLLDEDVRSVDVKETSRRILDNALRQNPHPEVKIQGQVRGARVHLPSRQATPLACIVNELVYNAIAHAFPGRDQGGVTISMQEATGGQILVQVSDDGVGLPDEFSMVRDAHLGLRIVEGLVSQDLAGKLSLTGNGGTTARVTFQR